MVLFFNMVTCIYTHQVAYSLPKTYLRKKLFERVRAERINYEGCACGVSLNDKKHSDELLSRLGIECVDDKIQRARLRWFGHVERQEENERVNKCTRMNVTIVMGRGALSKT